MEEKDDEFIQIILLGDFCGKTSLLKRYTKDVFNENHNPTLGKIYIYFQEISFLF